MDLSFAEILSDISTEKIFCTHYYKLVDVKKKLMSLCFERAFIDRNYHILPFYICDEGTYEVYWYEYTMCLVDKPSFEEYILLKTGSKNIAAVDESIRKKMENLYLEVADSSGLFPLSKLFSYIEFVVESDSIKLDVTEAFKRISPNFEFNDRNLYLEIY